MSITILQLMAKVGIDTKEAEAGLASVSGAGKAMSGGMVLAAGVAAVAVVGIGAASLKMAGDFQKGVTTLVTGGGESKKNLQLVSDGILQIARDTGTSTQQLISGMYMIESAGNHGAKGLDILRMAAEGARAEGSDLGTVSDALTTILKDFPNVTNGAAGAMNTLIATVESGKTHMQDLAGALSGVLPTAAAAGVGLNSVMGAMATMTAQGTPAANAATYLRQLIIALSAPSKQAADELGKIGLTSKQVANEMHTSLPGALKMITDALAAHGFKQSSAEYVAALKEIAGGSRQMQGMLQLTGSHLQEFADVTKHVGDTVKEGGGQVRNWGLIQGEFNVQAARAKEVVETLMISLGQHLLPVGTALFRFLANNLIPTVATVVQWFTGMSASAQLVKALLLGFAIAIIISLVPAFVAWTISAGAAAVATIAATWPILAVGAAIGLLLLGLKYAYDHWTGFRTVVNSIPPVLGAVKDAIGWVIGRLGDLLGLLGRVKDAIGGAFGGLGGIAKAFHIPGFASGTNYAPGGLAVVGERGPELVNLPQGSQVIPLPGGMGGGSIGGGGGGGGGQVITIILDGAVLARSVVRNMPRELRLVTGRRDM